MCMYAGSRVTQVTTRVRAHRSFHSPGFLVRSTRSDSPRLDCSVMKRCNALRIRRYRYFGMWSRKGKRPHGAMHCRRANSCPPPHAISCANSPSQRDCLLYDTASSRSCMSAAKRARSIDIRPRRRFQHTICEHITDAKSRCGAQAYPAAHTLSGERDRAVST
eukprot:4117390-Prymnesium_polylepis.1